MPKELLLAFIAYFFFEINGSPVLVLVLDTKMVAVFDASDLEPTEPTERSEGDASGDLTTSRFRFKVVRLLLLSPEMIGKLSGAAFMAIFTLIWLFCLSLLLLSKCNCGVPGACSEKWLCCDSSKLSFCCRWFRSQVVLWI